jgi:hypothetical protein
MVGSRIAKSHCAYCYEYYIRIALSSLERLRGLGGLAAGERPTTPRHCLLGPGGTFTTPTDMATWLPVAHDHGRPDLDAGTLNRRRDAFLHAALD